MTAELEAERARRDREYQLAEAQAVAQLGSFEWALASDQVTWSAELCRILGLDPEACRGTIDGLLQRIHPDDRPEAAATLRRAATDGTSFRMQVRILRPSGEQRVLSSWGDVTRDEQGRPSRMLGVCQDVTDWRQREEQLIDAQAQAELSRRLQSGLLPEPVAARPGAGAAHPVPAGARAGAARARTSSTPCRWPTAPSPC